MKNPPGYGSIVDLGKKRRRPIAVRVPNGKKFNKQGKEIIDYKYLGYFERTNQGKADAQNLLAQYNSGALIDIPKSTTSCPSFGELSEIWLEKHLGHIQAQKGKVSIQLKHSYSAALLKCSSISGKRIDCIKFQDIQNIADSISNMSLSTVTNVKTVLFETFDLARKQKYISENFIADVDFIYKTTHEKIHSAFTRSEIELLWEHAADQNVQIVLIMVYTGMRIEELLSMKTENVHLDKKCMVGGVKTSAGINRVIPISDKIYPFVQSIYDPASTYLLSHNLKRYSRSNFLKYIWDPAMTALDLKHLPHDTRYACATMMDRAGVNENSKKTILGHSKEGVTNKIYVEKDLNDLLNAINMI